MGMANEKTPSPQMTSSQVDSICSSTNNFTLDLCNSRTICESI